MEEPKICSKFEAAFEVLGKRWTGLIVYALLAGGTRFSEIAEMIPHMSDKMLVDRLKELEAAGIVIRNVYPETPVRIEYALTAKGRDLHSVMARVQAWAEVWIEPTGGAATQESDVQET